MRRFLLALLASSALLAVATPLLSAENAGPALPTRQLSAGLYLIKAEVAAAPAELQRGLMYRRELGEHEGMLFLFAHTGRQCMWMRNTLIPLSVAFLRDDGTIVNIEDMAPQTETNHCSSEPVRAALEMNQGWFAKRGIRAGSRIKGMPAF